MMIFTEFFPDWSANEELREVKAEVATTLESDCYAPEIVCYRGYDLFESPLYDTHYIHVGYRVKTMPAILRDVPMSSIHVVTRNYKLTAAVDGSYEDGNISARVDTHVINRNDVVARQEIRVTGVNGTTFEELNPWFDDLVTGKKNDKNVNPIYTISPRIVLRTSGGSGPMAYQVEVEMSGVPADLAREISELLSAHFAELKRSMQ